MTPGVRIMPFDLSSPAVHATTFGQVNERYQVKLQNFKSITCAQVDLLRYSQDKRILPISYSSATLRMPRV